MSSRLADRLGPHTPSQSVAWSFGCSGKLQRCRLRSHTVVIAPQELITQQKPRFVSPAARCTHYTVFAVPHSPSSRVFASIFQNRVHMSIFWEKDPK